MTAPVTTLNIGDTVPIGTVMANLIIMGIVTDINNPNMFSATLQAFQSNAVLTVPVLQGIPGNPGQPSFALRFQNSILASPADLPSNLGNTSADLGKYWVFGVQDNNGNVIATEMYVWYGTSLGYESFPVGSPGPPGPYPVITPQLILLEPGNGLGPNGVSSWIAVTGTVSNPTFTYYVAAPQGIAGPSAFLDTCPDINFTTGPVPGDTLTCTSQIVPGAPTSLTAAPSSSGGSFAAGQYFWAVTAILTNGSETMASNEVEVLLAGTSSSVGLSWTAPNGGGAAGYNVYRGTSATQISVLVTTINDGTITTYTDTGSAGTPASPPSVGVVAGRAIWAPKSSVQPAPLFFTVPQSAFTSQSGVGGSSQPVCTFDMPQQPWPWVPFVFGQMNIFGVNISLTPLLIGAEVTLGSVNGQFVAGGVGNSLGAVNIIPNASNANNPSAAITPTNAIAQVPANHTGTQGTLYVSLVNQGMAGVYDFNAAGAGLAVLVVPIVGS